MRKGWIETNLGGVTKHFRGTVKVQNGVAYKAAGVMMEGRGLIHREPFIGGVSGYKKLTPISPGQLVLRSITAWEAPITVVPSNEFGLHVSGVFPVFNIDESLLIPEYMSLICRWPSFWNEMRIRATGTVLRRKTLNASQLQDIPLILPPLAEQKRIVHVVSSVDANIEALQQQADSARAARDAVLHDLLSAGGDEWAETTLGEIGLNGMFADGDWVESKDQDPAGEYRLLQLADVGDGVFLDKSNRWMNSEQFHRLRCTPLNPRDILIARMPDPIARACVVPFGLPTCATVVDVAILRCGGRFLPEFVVLVINDSAFRTQAQSLLTGTTRQRISRSNLAKIICKIPSLTEQKRIVEIVSSVDEVIHSTEQAVVDAKALRSGLLSDLLSGNHEIPASYDSLLGPE